MLRSFSSLATTFRLPWFGVVHRLRLVFMLIVGVIGIAVALSLWQFSVFRNAQTDLLQRSIPILVRTQVLERQLNDVISTLGRIKAIDNQPSLPPLVQQLEAETVGARASVLALINVDERRIRSTNLLDQMDTLKASTKDHLSLKRTLFDIQKRQKLLQSVLDRQRSEIRRSIEVLSFEAERALNDTVAQSRAGEGKLDVTELDTRMRTAARVTKLAQELETIANVVSQITNVIPDQRLATIQSFLEFRFRGAVQMLAGIPPNETRTRLAIETSELRETIFGPSGLLNNIAVLKGETRNLEARYDDEKKIVQGINRTTERLVAAAYNQVVASSGVTQATTQSLILILTITAIVVSIIVVLATLVVVERQINRRIGQLTGSVTRIAAGDLEHETSVSGTDELGHMARALDVFKKNAQELVRSNAELEQFAYAAAHDLKSPLQGIEDLASWIEEDDENELSASSAEYLDMLRQRATRLSVLLADLLQYARVGADVTAPAVVDLETIVRESAEITNVASRFDVSYTGIEGPLVAPETPLRKVLLNLMSNTLKHHGSQQGKITVNATINGDRLNIEYHDDGKGIPTEYHEKVFQLFQTLQPRDQIEGSGLGLAISQKLIAHFDGSISIQSNPEQGSGVCFRFDLPASIYSEASLAA